MQARFLKIVQYWLYTQKLKMWTLLNKGNSFNAKMIHLLTENSSLFFITFQVKMPKHLGTFSFILKFWWVNWWRKKKAKKEENGLYLLVGRTDWHLTQNVCMCAFHWSIYSLTYQFISSGRSCGLHVLGRRRARQWHLFGRWDISNDTVRLCPSCSDKVVRILFGLNLFV